jgi:shikimate kinase
MSTATLNMPTTQPTRTQPTETTLGDHPAAHPASPHLASHLDRIVLTGFMGSGKTTTGRLLAERLGWTFLDLDHEIEARQALASDPALTVPAIFALHGEPHFRRLEARALATLLGRSHVVIALGGGAPEELGNRLLLEQTPRTAVIHLAAPFDVLLDRCRAQAVQPNAAARPNLADTDHALTRYLHRRPLYDRLAAHTIHTATQTPTDTVQAILTALTPNP